MKLNYMAKISSIEEPPSEQLQTDYERSPKNIRR